MKRLLAIILCGLLSVTLCGCKFSVLDTDKLLTPPQLSGELAPIQKALVQSIKGDYTLKYPSFGDIKSAVVTEDVDGDGEKEAFAFYSITDGDETSMHINMIKKDGNGYKSIDDSSIVASGVEKVDFYDINGDGEKEIIVGWEIYAETEKNVAVYSCSKNKLSQLMLQRYTNFLCADLDQNGKTEMLIQELSVNESSNIASVYTISDNNALIKISECLMDGKVKSAGKFVLSSLSNGQPAVYVDETKGIGAVTEVLFMVKEQLFNPLLDVEGTMENIKTIRPSAIPSADINEDGIIEIPMVSDLAAAEENSTDKFYYTNWCSFNGESLTVKRVTVVNTSDGYSINLPKRFIGNAAVSKDAEKRTRTFFNYDTETNTLGEKILTFKAMTKEEFEKEKERTGKNKAIFSKDDTVVIVISVTSGENPITEEELKNILSFNAF